MLKSSVSALSLIGLAAGLFIIAGLLSGLSGNPVGLYSALAVPFSMALSLAPYLLFRVGDKVGRALVLVAVPVLLYALAAVLYPGVFDVRYAPGACSPFGGGAGIADLTANSPLRCHAIPAARVLAFVSLSVLLLTHCVLLVRGWRASAESAGKQPALSRTERSARRAGVVAALIAFPVVAVGWVAGSFVVSGATFGGYGTGPTVDEDWWRSFGKVATTTVSICILTIVGHLAYWTSRRFADRIRRDSHEVSR